jgi:hypothetical protein
MPGDGPKDDSASVSTATTETNSNDKIAMDLEKEPEEKMGVSLGQFTNERKMEKAKGNGRKMSAKDRLKVIFNLRAQLIQIGILYKNVKRVSIKVFYYSLFRISIQSIPWALFLSFVVGSCTLAFTIQCIVRLQGM